MAKIGYVYILTNKNRTVLYTGVTSNLIQRLMQHVYESKGFVKRYSVHYLVYFESIHGMMNAIRREKEIKGWTRAKKETLIVENNPEWRFLNEEVLGEDL
ncbi:MAG: GIY-YIG nuclease family protein [Flavobacteriales bacterium]|nr:GIY-YIG nuclease family protein [Flavobacteriales bacterium]NNK80953.1 GIY-YIG nuclease family protein [Flavobacteriales bacterium]